jgi:hypothetical protein
MVAGSAILLVVLYEIVRSIVGDAGLVLAVPFTTLITAIVAVAAARACERSGGLRIPGGPSKGTSAC